MRPEISHYSDEQWRPLFDEAGIALNGITGKRGVAVGDMGCAFIRMQPGSSFPVHTHHGDHILLFLKGRGCVSLDGSPIEVCAGHVVHIAARYPHAVSVATEEVDPLTFLSVGHPHIDVFSTHRMQVVK